MDQKLATLLENIGQCAEQLDDALFALKTMNSLPPAMHIQGLSGTTREVRDALVEIYAEYGGTEELNIQA